MSIISKVTCFIIMLSSFSLILMTGRRNIRNFESVQVSIKEMYDDRLVVKGLIFDLSSLLHIKEIASLKGSKRFYIQTNNSAEVNEKIDKILSKFRNTKLTTLEEKTLNKFSEGIKNLLIIEAKTSVPNPDSLTEVEISRLSGHLKSLQTDLKTLSQIQLSEGKRKVKISDNAVISMNEFESIENYAMILLGILMLGTILAPRPRAAQIKKFENI